MARIKIYLVPGFFGFTHLGSINYFHRVRETLAAALQKRNFHADILETRTRPTGSLRKRADRLLEDVLLSDALEADELHFIGHSTGGLDVRLLLTPDVHLRPGNIEHRIAQHTSSAISIATPHHGTPLANFFTTFQGRHLLQLLTLLATSTPGKQSLLFSSQLLQFIARLDDSLGRRTTLLDQLSSSLLSQLTLSEDDPVWTFLQEIASDQGAILQLTPEVMDLFNASVTPNPSIHYQSIVTATPQPSLRSIPGLSFTNLDTQRVATHAVFRSLHTITSKQHHHYPYPVPLPAHRSTLQAEIPFPVTPSTNDGVVPTLSQLHGDLIATSIADHLDVVGQFRGHDDEDLSDWLSSGAHFRAPRFLQLWDTIADAIVRNSAASQSSS